MHKFIEKIKKFESKPFIVSNFLNKEEVKLFQNLYNELPLEVDNKRQKIVKKKWSVEFGKELQKKYIQKLKVLKIAVKVKEAIISLILIGAMKRFVKFLLQISSRNIML